MNAAVERVLDTDGDGLVDLVEHDLGTRIDRADTDGDGVSDGEELARGSSSRLAHSFPRERPVDVGMIAHSIDSMLHVQVFVYAANGDPRGINLFVSALAGAEGRVVQIPTDVLVRIGGVSSFEAADGRGRIFVLDLPIRPRTVYTSGSLSVAASVAAPLTGQPGTADTLDLVVIDGTICQRIQGFRTMNSSSLPGGGGSGTGGISGTFDASGGAQGVGSIFQPIFTPGSTGTVRGGTDGGDQNPATSTPGQVCVQQTVQVGVSGGAVIEEIVGAECVSGWDGFCSSTCLSSVGARIRAIDPVIYSGG